MKLKVIVHAFWFELVLIALTALIFAFPNFILFKHFNVDALVAPVIGVVLSGLFRPRRYLTDITSDDEEIVLTYLTSYTREVKIFIRYSTIVDIKLRNKIFNKNRLGSIEFFSKKNQIFFFLLDDATRDKALQVIDSILTKDHESILENAVIMKSSS